MQSSRLPGGSASQLMWSLERDDFDNSSLTRDDNIKHKSSVNTQISGAVGTTMRAPPAYWRKTLLANMKSKGSECTHQSDSSTSNGLRSRKQNLASIRDIERRAGNVDFFYGSDDDRVSSDVPFVAHVASLLRASCTEACEDAVAEHAVPAFGILAKSTPRPRSDSRKTRPSSSPWDEHVPSENFQRKLHVNTEDIIEQVLPTVSGKHAISDTGCNKSNIMQAWVCAQSVLSEADVQSNTTGDVEKKSTFSVSSPTSQLASTRSHVERPRSGTGSSHRPMGVHVNGPVRGASSLSNTRKVRLA